MDKKYIFGGIVLALALGIAGLFLPQRSVLFVGGGDAKDTQKYGGTTGLDSLALKGNLSVDGTTTLTGTSAFATASSTGLFSLSSLKIGYGGTEISKHLKTTATIDADSIGNGAATTSAVTLTGATANGSVFVTRTGSWASASSTINIFGVAGTDSVTLYFQNNSSMAVDLTNSTYIVDYYAH